MLGLALLGLAACSSSAERAGPEPAASATAATSAGSSISTTASARSPEGEAPPPPPTLKPVPHPELGGKAISRLFWADGALLVTGGDRVGRIDGDRVEWLGQTPASPEFLGGGPSSVFYAGGKYPDRIDVAFYSSNGRAPMPTIMALTGKGEGHTFAPGGGLGLLIGVATVGESTLVMGYTMEGFDTIRIRGPIVARVPTKPEQGGCKPGEVRHDEYHKGYAVDAKAFGASEDGTAILIGMLCDKRPAAEIWDREGRSKIHELGAWVKEITYDTQLLHGPGDVSWIVTRGSTPIVEHRGGKLAPLPVVPNLTTAFVSSSRVLHVVDGQSIHRWVDGRFEKVADVIWPHREMTFGEWGGRFYTTLAATLHRLEKAEPITHREGCPTPFVYLYDVSEKSEPGYTFPTTRKALASFDRVSELSLVEFVEGVRRLGIVVPDGKTGEAVVAHVEKTMKDERPRLLCYAPPKEKRVIDLSKTRP